MSHHTTTPPQGEPAAEFVQLDPATLLTDHNLRQVRADDAFRQLVASIREHGVLVPVVATRDHQGLRVRYGHRRALAAVQAGRETVPVVVYTGTLTDAAAAEIDRILGQHAENTHRAGLTTGETVAAFGQLAALGQTPARIARRSKTPARPSITRSRLRGQRSRPRPPSGGTSSPSTTPPTWPSSTTTPTPSRPSSPPPRAGRTPPTSPSACATSATPPAPSPPSPPS
jgi:ParB/RepB/Spo0J family partition protein